MTHEQLIKANAINEKIEKLENAIEELIKRDITNIEFSERFTDDSILISSEDADEEEDINNIVKSYIDILSKKVNKLKKEFENL